MAKSSQRNSKYLANPTNRQKTIAREQTAYAIKTGKLVRRPCEVCGTEPAEAHHPDYSQPMNVQWLCIPHHKAAHTNTKTHCKHGHALTPDNVTFHAEGRRCRECYRLRDARNKQRRHAAKLELRT